MLLSKNAPPSSVRHRKDVLYSSSFSYSIPSMCSRIIHAGLITITSRTESLFFSSNKEIVVDILQRLFFTFFYMVWTFETPLSYLCILWRKSRFLFSSRIVFLFFVWQWKIFCLLLNIVIKCCNWSEITKVIVFPTQDNLVLAIFIKIQLCSSY